MVWRSLGGDLVWRALPLAAILIWISHHDFRTREIPDLANLLLVAFGVWQLMGATDLVLWDLLLGAVVWSFLFWLVARFYLELRGFEGLGLGDVKLMVGGGLIVGVSGGARVVAAASIGAIATIIFLRALRQREQPLAWEAVAFGPYLCLSLWGIWLAGV